VPELRSATRSPAARLGRIANLRESTPEVHLARNIRGYSRRAADYESLHGEIFNELEQQRLRRALSEALAAVRSGGTRALDYGTGTGNLTRHLLDLGASVTAADVSPVFLQMVGARYGVQTIELRDGSLEHLPDACFDLIGVYSVLHHIPDYLTAAAGLVGKLKRGGVLLIDHEHNEHHWSATPALMEFREQNARAGTGGLWDPQHRRWQHLLRAALVPARHRARLQRLMRVCEEGDIHVYPDDHIEWDALVAALEGAGAELVSRSDYLAFCEGYDEAVWERHLERCDDTACVMLRRL
jgi:SAM-dependent methyltransferase